jgi:enoyl-CoA hydratase
MRRAPQPIVAAVHGPACGGRLRWRSAADVRVAGESARMNAAFIRLGLSACDVGVSYFCRASSRVRRGRALLTGNFIDAARAERGRSRVAGQFPMPTRGRCSVPARDMLRNSPSGCA